MVKKSVLLMSFFALGLTLGSEVGAGKEKKEVSEGPMDRYVVRKSPLKRAGSPLQDSRFSGTGGKKARSSFKKEEICAYESSDETGSDADPYEGLLPAHRAFLLKTESAN